MCHPGAENVHFRFQGQMPCILMMMVIMFIEYAVGREWRVSVPEDVLFPPLDKKMWPVLVANLARLILYTL